MNLDVLVLGAGPAGSSTARRLAAAGAQVALIGGPARPGCEGLSSRTMGLLAEEGLPGLAALARGPLPRAGRWAAGRAVTGSESLVDRAALADALRRCAVAAGARDVREVVADVTRLTDGWRVARRGAPALSAPLLVDARGRRGAAQRGPVLLAVGQSYLTAAPRHAGTRVHATDQGWVWAATAGRELWVQVVGRPRAGLPRDWLRSAVEEHPELARLLAGAKPLGSAVARPAHARLGIHGPDPSRWQVGDAAFALDPLSGQGVYEALRGARLVSTALLNVLDGGDAALAQRFVRERTREAWQRGVSLAAGFYHEWAARSAFWAQTAAAYAALREPAVPQPPHVARRPVLEHGRIVEREVIITGSHRRGVWQVAGVPVAELKGYLERAAGATLMTSASALAQPPAAVAVAVRWLHMAGALSSQVLPSMESGG